MKFYSKTKKAHKNNDLDQSLLEIIVARAIILLVGISLSDAVGLLPDSFGSLPFAPFFNILALSLTVIYLVIWYSRRARKLQLFLQIAVDLILATILVASARGIEGPFVSFYLLIIIYCSLTLGKNGGILGATLSSLCYAAVVFAIRMGMVPAHSDYVDVSLEVFKVGFHVLGFGAVAYLGTYLHCRLRFMERALQEKSDSLIKLRQLNERIISSIRSGLITTDLAGRIAVFNTAAGELTGKKPQSVLGTPIHEIIGQKFWELILKDDLLRSAQPARHSEWIHLPNGSMRYMGFSVSPLLDQENRQLGYIISFQDLSEIVRLEKEIRLRERMAAVGRMAAGIAHEIRNPLTAMRGSAEILRAHANLPEKDERLLSILIRESDRLNSFIKDFLDFARPKPRAKKRLDLVPLLRDAVALLENSSEIRGKYTITFAPDVPELPVIANADQMRQVFWNVTQNALRAMPDGGALIIGTAQTAEGIGFVTFTDTGIGMTGEEIDQIFQPFHSGFSQGLGLGLSIIFQIMEDHRGRIEFASEKGKGTKVMLSFPLEVAMPQADWPLVVGG